MRRYTAFKIMFVLLLSVPVCFQACVKDTCKSAHTYSYYVPVYKTKEEVRNNIRNNPAHSIQEPGKIAVLDKTIFLNEKDKGIHVIDNTDPSNPKRISFIDIPGNLDIAVKGNTLYADLYTDLVTLDITDPAHVVVKKVIDNIFPYRFYGSGFVANDQQVIVDWIRKDTTVEENCDQAGMWGGGGNIYFLASSQSGSAATSPIGVGGSMARFTIMNNRLYTVGQSDLDIFNISNANDPVESNKVHIGWDIETIYPFKNKLFIGSASGMFIYNVSNADQPVQSGQFVHARACDPVVADDNHAYVTLRSGSMCQGFNNQLDVVALNDFVNPYLEKSYPLTNPRGLSKDGNLLFICDGTSGLKLYDASNVMDLKLIKTVGNMETYDVIAYNKWALVVATDGLYQYDYSTPSAIRLVSKISVSTQ